MTRVINDENAESIGKTIMEKALQLVARSDHAYFITCFPNLRVYQGQENFDDAAESLKLLGDSPTGEYLDQLTKPNCNVLLWLVQSRQSDMALLLRLELTESEGEVKLAHLSFKKLHGEKSRDSERPPKREYLNIKNQESLGAPIIESILKSLLTSDFELYCQNLPEVPRDNLDNVMEIFDEAVEALKPMGDMKFIKYLAHAKTTELYTLFWKVRYEKKDEDLLFDLILTENKGKIKLEGFAFDR